MDITDAISVVKRAQAAERKANKDREEINWIAKKQRVEIRRLKRLLEEVVKLVPVTVHNDELFEEIDKALYKDEL